MSQGRSIYSVYPDDVDAFGIMHHANFFRYFERARTDWLQLRGFKYSDLIASGVNFVVSKADLSFITPAKLYDQMEIVTTIHSRRRASQVYEQIIYDHTNHDLIFCRGLITVVCVNEQLKPRAFPAEILEEF